MFKATKTILTKLDEILVLLRLSLISKGASMIDLSALQAAVAANTNVQGSVATLLQSLEQNAADPVALAAMVTQISANTASWQAAIVANTPVQHTPPAPATPVVASAQPQPAPPPSPAT